MVKINGVNVSSLENKKQVETKPTLGEILNRMEENYELRNSVSSASLESNKKPSTQNSNGFNEIYGNSNYNNVKPNFNNIQPNNTQTNFEENIPQPFNDSNNLLLSVLPKLLSKNKNAFAMKNGENFILKELLKTSNNPRLAKMLELLPKLMPSKLPEFMTTETAEAKNDVPKIDTYTKTSDYVDE